MEKYGLKYSEIEEIKRICKKHIKHFGSVSVYIFGSRARGDQRMYSDVDLLFIPSTRGVFSKIDLDRISSDLDDSDLPYKFDLVLEEDLADSYKQNVNSDKKIFFK